MMITETAPNVGQCIRSIREQRGWSLRALAERSGLSINAISLIERGENSPTVSTLHLLATALDVCIADFFTEEDQQVAVFVRPAFRLRSEAEGIVMESLGIGLQNQELEPFLLTIAAGSGNIGQPIDHPGEEFVYCLEGEIDYFVGDTVYNLEPGCSLLLEATTPHCFCNPAQQPALLVMVYHAGASGHLARRLQLDLKPKENADEDVRGSDSR
jgi:transcriptional regulator with XRE-family HTH domain